ncbi:hypothetical protein NPIL_109571 [Nephila pilipes]|uniref:Uncharacterized protein n=1 Tax=Nephila pilipes TaxID=299642 RepID=A0A8X6N6L1_NEPPI|nr:hypothetical protein NPIL_109571 [Nephila pilipes]
MSPEDTYDKIDISEVSLLASFVEALLELDDIDNAFQMFENLSTAITSSVAEHFNLTPPSQRSKSNGSSSSRKTFDPENAQEIQKLYRWNRRRCIRNLTSQNSSSFQIKKPYSITLQIHGHLPLLAIRWNLRKHLSVHQSSKAWTLSL